MFWSNPNFLSDFIRGMFTFLDSIGYFFLSGIFNIFFVVANATIFQGDVINNFYSRVQMILGVLMIFRLSITLLQIILNPDMFKDKQKGAGSLVKRIALMLVMLTLIVPIDVPNNGSGNPLNEQIASNGILFGFLYQFQNSVVQDNILGKLILGYNSSDSNLDLEGMSSVGDVITAQIASAFVTPTLNDGYDNLTIDNVDQAAACPDDARSYLGGPTANSLLDHVNDTCDVSGDEVYSFNYTGLGGIIVSVVMTIIIIGFTLDVAVRAIKLALLRLIAPVPIISYISPGQEKDGAFGNWVKTLTSTYISLFVRLIIIYFGIYLIILLRKDGLVSWASTPSFITSALANIFIIIGILVFMKQAPKFFQDMLGLKGDGKLFSGIGTMLGAAALTGGLAGSAAVGYRAYREEHPNAGVVRSALLGGGTSLLGGAFAGGKALATADKKAPSSVMSAMQKRNAMRASHSTLPGRVSSGAFGMFTGRTLAEKDQQILDLNEKAASEAKTLKGLEEEEAAKNVAYIRYNLTDANNHTAPVNVDYNSLMSAMAGTDADGNFTYQGVKYSRDNFGKHITDDILKQTTQAYVDGTAVLRSPDSDSYANNGKIISQKKKTDYAFSQAGGDAAKVYADGNYRNLGKSIGAATAAATEMSTTMKNIKHRANHNANKNG